MTAEAVNELDVADLEDLSPEEQQALLDADHQTKSVDQKLVDQIAVRVLIFVEELIGHKLFPYQRGLSYRVVESVITGDSATITALFSRQCLDGDTVVFRRDGTVARLREHEDAFQTGVEPTKRYRFRGGGEVVMTDNHPVWTREGWTAAGLLRPGDKVAALMDLPRWLGETSIDREVKVGRHETPTRVTVDITPDVAKMLGYFVTDGSYRPGQSAKFTNTREEYLSEFATLIEKTFGVVPRRYEKGNGADLLLTTLGNSTYGKGFRNFLTALEWDHGFILDVFRWTPDLASDFVNRVWAGDGCISMKRTGPDIFLACGNDEIYARYWQALLHKFGVQSTVKREVMAKGTGTFHRLVVACGARNVKRFFQSFGIIYGKEEQCARAIAYFADKAKRPSGKGRAEREMMKYIATAEDDEVIGWTTVVSIEDAGVRPVYDMEVAGKGWFIAQGVQVGNSGKTETVSATVAGLMVLLPKLALIFPMLEKFKDGFWVGVFAPVEGQAETLFGRIVGFLTSDRAMDLLLDPEIDARPSAKTRVITLKGLGSICRMQTANPKAKIEGRSYHLLVVDESQGADARVVRKSIRPMGAFYGATTVMLGTPDVVRGVFYDTIKRNERVGLKRGAKQNHFQHDWQSCARYNPDYARYVRGEMADLGEDSEEFRLSYKLEWLLDRGMFTTSAQFDECTDKTMKVIPVYTATPVVAGIDLARRVDSTVVTVVWVDWDHPIEDGYFEHRVLSWLELQGEDWEEQYFQIVDFLRNYRLYAVGVDGQGLGDVFASRLRRLMPDVEIVALESTLPRQSERWKHLMTLIQRGLMYWPGHSSTRRTRVWRRFQQQMLDLEKKQTGPHFIAEAPKGAEAHDDYPDSLAIACVLSKEQIAPEVESMDNPFFSRSR